MTRYHYNFLVILNLKRKTMANSEYVDEIKDFSKNAAEITRFAQNKFQKAANTFFREMEDLKHTGSEGSRTWMAEKYITAIINSLGELGILEVYHTNTHLNVKVNGHEKTKRADLLVIHDKNFFIIELKSSATLNAIMSAAGEFLIYRNIGGEFSSPEMKKYKINFKSDNVHYILFSGYCDSSYEKDIRMTKEAFGINFHAFAWYRSLKLRLEGKWSYSKGVEEFVSFLKIIHGEDC